MIEGPANGESRLGVLARLRATDGEMVAQPIPGRRAMKHIRTSLGLVVFLGCLATCNTSPVEDPFKSLRMMWPFIMRETGGAEAYLREL
jgi:hypothetical protein